MKTINLGGNQTPGLPLGPFVEKVFPYNPSARNLLAAFSWEPLIYSLVKRQAVRSLNRPRFQRSH